MIIEVGDQKKQKYNGVVPILLSIYKKQNLEIIIQIDLNPLLKKKAILFEYIFQGECLIIGLPFPERDSWTQFMLLLELPLSPSLGPNGGPTE